MFKKVVLCVVLLLPLWARAQLPDFTDLVEKQGPAVVNISTTQTVRSQLAFARKGLSDLDVKPDFLGILEKRLENKNTPGEYVAKLWQSKFNGSVEQTLPEILADIWERTKGNQPIS